MRAAALTEARRRTGARHLARLREALDVRATLSIPELSVRAPGRRVVSLIAEHLVDELGEPAPLDRGVRG